MRYLISFLLIIQSLNSFSQSDIQLFLSKGDTLEAIYFLKDLVKNEEAKWSDYYNLGLLLHSAGQTEESSKYFMGAYQIDSEQVEPAYFLGNYFFEIDSISRAEFFYSIYLSENEDNREVRYKRALANMRLRDHYSAITDWSYLARSDTNPDLIFNRGLSRLALNDLEGARDDFKKVIESNQNYTDAYYFTGLSWYHSLELKKAEKNWKMVLKLDAGYINAWYQLAILYAKVGKNNKSCKNLDKARELGWKPAGEEDRKLFSHCYN